MKNKLNAQMIDNVLDEIVSNAEKEVAKKIFADIEKRMLIESDGTCEIDIYDIAILKKKYGVK